MRNYIFLLCGVACACMAFAQDAASLRPTNKTAVINHKALLTYVTEQPEGELRSYKRSGWAYVEEVDGIYCSKQSGTAKVVFSENNEVYLQNVISRINSGKWVKGTLGEDKKTITIATGAILEHVSVNVYDDVMGGYREYDGDLRLTMMKATLTDGGIAFTEDPSTPITYTLDGDSIVLNNTARDKEVLGAVYASFSHGAEKINGLWASYADCETRYGLFTERPLSVPDDVTLERYALVSKEVTDEPPTYETSFVQVGMKDDDVYLASFTSLFPDVAIKGTVKGTTIEFPSRQYLGDAHGYTCYLMTSSYALTPDEWGFIEQTHTLTDKFVFNYDAKTHTLTPAAPQTALLVNANDAYPYAFNTYNEPTLKLQVDEPATPAMPEVLNVEDYYESEGDWCVSIRIDAVSTEGDVLDKEKLFYRIYINDKLYTFTNELYGFGEDMTLIPYDFNDSKNGYISPVSHGINVYVQEETINNVGVQALYKGGNEEHASDIAWWGDTGLKSIENNMHSHLTNQRYNLPGQPVKGDYKGVTIMNRQKLISK